MREIPEKRERASSGELTPQELNYFAELKRQHGREAELNRLDMAVLQDYRQKYSHLKSDSQQNLKNIAYCFDRIYGEPDRRHNDHSSSPFADRESAPASDEKVSSYRLLSADGNSNNVVVGKSYRFTRYPNYHNDFSELDGHSKEFFNDPVIGKVKNIIRYTRESTGQIGYIIEIEPREGEASVGYIYDDGSSGAGMLRDVEEVD